MYSHLINIVLLDIISPTPSLSAETYSTNTQLLLAVVLPSIIIVIIIPFIIIILVCVCLLFTRYKKILSLNDDIVTTTVDPVPSTNPSYIPATVKTEENPAY